MPVGARAESVTTGSLPLLSVAPSLSTGRPALCCGAETLPSGTLPVLSGASSVPTAGQAVPTNKNTLDSV